MPEARTAESGGEPPVTGRRSRPTAPEPMLPPGDVGIMGSYASFFGFLLIATILSYRSIIWTLFDLLRQGLPEANISLVFFTMIGVFVLVFVCIPAYPISRDIRASIATGRTALAGVLIFLVIVYGIALVFQVGHVWQEFIIRFPHAFG